MSEQSFDFNRFVEDSKRTLLKPKEYFGSMSTEGGYTEPILKVLIYGAVAGFFYMIWSFLAIGASMGPFLGGATGFGALFFTIIASLIGLFIGGIIVLIVSAICNGNTNFEACVRVSASLMVVMPVSAVLAIFSGLSFFLGTLVGLAVNIYALYMLYIAITDTLKGSEKTAKTLSYILAGLLILFLIIGLATRQAVRTFSGVSEKKIERKLRELEKIGNEMAKDFEKAGEEMAGMAEEAKRVGERVTGRAGKPESFPHLACQHFSNTFKQTEPVLSKDLISNVISATNELKAYGGDDQEKALSILNQNGFNSQQEYVDAMKAATCGYMALGGLQATEELLEASEAEQQAAEAFVIDEAINSLVSQMINTGNLTENDMHTAYNNWDLLSELDGMVR